VFRIPGAQGRIGLIGALSERDFCSRCNRIRITSDGKLRPCLFSEKSLDLLTPMRQGVSDLDLEALIEEGVKMKNLRLGLCTGNPAGLQPGSRTMMNTLGG
jgi:GTP 3',8-cyclase